MHRAIRDGLKAIEEIERRETNRRAQLARSQAEYDPETGHLKRQCADLTDTGDPCPNRTQRGKRRCRTHHQQEQARRDAGIHRKIEWLEKQLAEARARQQRTHRDLGLPPPA